MINRDLIFNDKTRCVIKADCKVPLKILKKICKDVIDNKAPDESELNKNGFAVKYFQNLKQTIHIIDSKEDKNHNKQHEELIYENPKIPMAFKEKCSTSYLYSKQELSCIFSREDVFQAKMDAEADLLEKARKQDSTLKRIKKIIICGVTFSVDNGLIDYSSGRIEKDFGFHNMSFQAGGPLVFRKPCKWFIAYAKRFYGNSDIQDTRKC